MSRKQSIEEVALLAVDGAHVSIREVLRGGRHTEKLSDIFRSLNETDLTPPARKCFESWPRGVSAGLATGVVAVISTLILQSSLHPTWRELTASEMLFRPLDVVMVVVLVGLAWALLGRLTWAAGLVLGVSVLAAGLNRSKIAMRGEPLYPSDRSYLRQTGSLLAMVETDTAIKTFFPMALAVVLIFVVSRLVKRRFPPVQPRNADGRVNWRWLIVRAVALVLASGILVYAGGFNQSGNLLRLAYNQNSSWKPWSQLSNYRSNGFLGGFLYNLPTEAMEQPEAYSAASMGAIAQRYVSRAQELNAGRTGDLSDINVVFVLGESFSDPTKLEGLSLAENPIPYTQGLMEQAVAGDMYSHSYGGGTATMEFESLTGQLVGLFRSQVSSPYQMFVADTVNYPSIVGELSATGHHTVAIHSYHLDMFKRRDVYRSFGFDEVIDDDAMQSRERIEAGRFVSDAAAFDEVVHQIAVHDKPVFAHLVTMQNHTPFEGAYPDPIATNLSTAQNGELVGQYARGLAHSDAAFETFLSKIQETGERTVVVFYGDHHPGIYDDEFRQEHREALGRTPFLVWDSAGNKPEHVNGITPGLLLPLLYQVADAPMPPFVALLADVGNTVPVVLRSQMLGPDMRPVTAEELDPASAGLLDDMRMVQYDFSMGEGYALDVMWPSAIASSGS